MLIDIFQIYLGLVVISFGIKLSCLSYKISPTSETLPVSAQDKHTGNPGDWMVKMRKPKREIAVAGCNTEGEVVREIILMGYQIDEIKDIVQL
jgi:hypothetical protein